MDLKVDEAGMQRAEEVINQFREDYFRTKFSPVRNIYIDIETFQDFKLGALICLITTQAEYDYIKYIIGSKDSEYQMRLDDVTMSYFPVITNITDDDIDKFVANRDNHAALVKVSPMTLLYNEFCNMMKPLIERNDATEAKNNNITIHIGMNSVKYTKDDMVRLAAAIMGYDPRFKVEIYNKPLHAIGRSIGSYEFFIINNIKDFISTPYAESICNDELAIFYSTVLGFPLLETETTDLVEISELLANTELIFNTYMDFHYIPRGIGL